METSIVVAYCILAITTIGILSVVVWFFVLAYKNRNKPIAKRTLEENVEYLTNSKILDDISSFKNNFKK